MVSLERPVRFATLNVRGLSDRRRQRQLYRLAVEQDLDIIAVQETKIETDVSVWTTLGLGALVLIATGLCLWVLRRRRQHDVLRKHGIPGPQPSLFIGNWAELRKDPVQVMERWIKQYGKVFGYYVGEIPYIVITDVDLIKEIFLKRASTFCDRPQQLVNVEPFKSCIIGLEEGAVLRTHSLRHSLRQCHRHFNVNAIRFGLHLVCSADVMLELLDDAASKAESVDMFRVARGYSMDVITKCAFAWQVDCQKNPTDPILSGVQQVFNIDHPVINNMIRFPVMRKVLEWLYPYAGYYDVTTQITESVRKVVELRRSGQSPHATDMLQLMLDAQAGAGDETAKADHKSKLMEDRHLLSNSFIFLVAGFDTTASSLAFIIHILAKYPEQQEKIFSEIAEKFPGATELTYDGVQQLKHLDMVICETLRLYPPVVLFVNRLCREHTMVMGHSLPAGANVIVPTWHMHHDPDIWHEPFKFVPERFSQGDKAYDPSVYSPFGLGPRICIGKRFAILELKLAICKIIRKYKVAQCDQTQDPLRLVVPSVVINPEKGVIVNLCKSPWNKVTEDPEAFIDSERLVIIEEESPETEDFSLSFLGPPSTSVASMTIQPLVVNVPGMRSADRRWGRSSFVNQNCRTTSSSSIDA
ncbi:hypothetical protein HPB47_005873 [Ixodes persulcatus]|uniref:Uncharacterized protein n=1 Tax=Ixodes persulcatus TaxID=34615 RepID=A0AC60PCL4_IXOPE|nr:hypothetical protein HPB47_005873 [Ixodes persulcatus]